MDDTPNCRPEKDSAEPQEVGNASSNEMAMAYNPPLGIIHLLGWTGLVAFVLAVQRLLPVANVMWIPVLGPCLRLGNATVIGAALGSLCIAARRRGAGIAFPTQPGEWILIVLGLEYLVNVVAVRTIIHLISPLQSDEAVWLPTLVQGVLPLPLWLWPLVRLRHSPYWWYFAVGLAAQILLLGTFVAFRSSSPLGDLSKVVALMYERLSNYGPPMALGYAILRDFRSTWKRGWLHVVGVVMAVLSQVLQFLPRVWFAVAETLGYNPWGW